MCTISRLVGRGIGATILSRPPWQAGLGRSASRECLETHARSTVISSILCKANFSTHSFTERWHRYEDAHWCGDPGLTVTVSAGTSPASDTHIHTHTLSLSLSLVARTLAADT